jgi:uncharacterized protein (TIGR02147 family)
MLTQAQSQTPLHRRFLLDELSARKTRNPAYSLRAYARDLGLSLTALSDALAGKRQLSRKNVSKLASRLCWSPDRTRAALSEVKGVPAFQQEFTAIEEDHFRVISDWYCMAILALSGLKDHSSDPAWIAERLNISVFEAKSGLERLVRLGALRVQGGKLKQTKSRLSVSSEVPSSAIRKFHRSHLELAEASIDGTAMDLRELSAITFPADPKKLKEIKKEIVSFRRKIAKRMETEGCSEVYAFTMQLFPLTKAKEPKA